VIVNPETFVGKISGIPTRDDVSIPVEEHLIVELYSK
jgi:small subunit ribosomal protein S4